MKILRSILFVLLVWLHGVCLSAKDVVYDKSDSLLVEYLLEQAAVMPVSTNYNLYFARQLLGVKYVNYILEQTDEEQLIVDLRHLDCTTFVESVVALTVTAKKGKRSFRDFCKTLQTLRYRQGVITDFSSRLHYFTDWLQDNQRMGFVKWIQEPDPPFTATKTCTYTCMTRFWDKYKHLVADRSLIPKIAQCEANLRGTSFRYIPKEQLNAGKERLSCIQNGDILCMVTSAGCLDVAHLGIAVWHGNTLHMIDASMIHKKVTEEEKTMYEYQMTKPEQIGIIVARLKK